MAGLPDQKGAVPFAQVLAQSPRMPVASKSPRSVVGERVVEVADLVVLRAPRVDADERESVARDGVLAGHDLVVGDEEVLRALDAGLDLDPVRVAVGVGGQDVEAGVVERLLDGLAAEFALTGEHEVDAAALDFLGLLRVDRRGRRDLAFDHPDAAAPARR